VNVASLNYHFKSKENLRQEILNFIVLDFKEKILSIPETKNVAEYAIKIFDAMTLDSAKCLNQFKLFLKAEHHPCEAEPYPLGYERFETHLARELNTKVPESERLWFVSVVLSYIIHNAVLSSTTIGKKTIKKFFPGKQSSLPIAIGKLVESLIRDLNAQYS
jgi:AcrR family transcriptional regulator